MDKISFKRLKKLQELGGEDSLVQEELRRLEFRREPISLKTLLYNTDFSRIEKRILSLWGYGGASFMWRQRDTFRKFQEVQFAIENLGSQYENFTLGCHVGERVRERVTRKEWVARNLEWVRGEEKKKWKRYA